MPRPNLLQLVGAMVLVGSPEKYTIPLAISSARRSQMAASRNLGRTGVEVADEEVAGEVEDLVDLGGNNY